MEAEQKIVDAANQRAAAATSNAEKIKEEAMERMHRIVKQNEDESQALESKMSVARKQKEVALKKRLAEKRAAKLKDITDPEAIKAEEVKLAQEEHESMLALQKEAAAAEEKERERRKTLQEAEVQKAQEEVKKAELEAAVTAARELALKTFKENQAQIATDTNMKEVARLKNEAEAQHEKLKEEEAHLKTHNKDKLAERLAAKKAKKEKELAEAEARAMADLAEKQKADLAEKEANRLAKLQWSDRVNMALSKAKELHMAPAETEDYCYQEVLEQQLVPQRQLSAAVHMIMKERHNSEMSTLLSANFNQRIAALKKAVESVIDAKAKAKIVLMEESQGQSDDDAPCSRNWMLNSINYRWRRSRMRQAS